MIGRSKSGDIGLLLGISNKYLPTFWCVEGVGKKYMTENVSSRSYIFTYNRNTPKKEVNIWLIYRKIKMLFNF